MLFASSWPCKSAPPPPPFAPPPCPDSRGHKRCAQESEDLVVPRKMQRQDEELVAPLSPQSVTCYGCGCVMRFGNASQCPACGQEALCLVCTGTHCSPHRTQLCFMCNGTGLSADGADYCAWCAKGRGIGGASSSCAEPAKVGKGGASSSCAEPAKQSQAPLVAAKVGKGAVRVRSPGLGGAELAQRLRAHKAHYVAAVKPPFHQDTTAPTDYKFFYKIVEDGLWSQDEVGGGGGQM
jgi:hypothetical protein